MVPSRFIFEEFFVEFLVIGMDGSRYSQSPDSSEGLGPRESHSRATSVSFGCQTILAASGILPGLMPMTFVADSDLTVLMP